MKTKMKAMFAVILLCVLAAGCSDSIENKLAKEFGTKTAQQLNNEKIYLLLVARRDVPKGAVLALADLGMQNFRASDIKDPKAVVILTDSEDGKRYAGKATTRDIKMREPILISDLVGDGTTNEPNNRPEVIRPKTGERPQP